MSLRSPRSPRFLLIVMGERRGELVDVLAVLAARCRADELFHVAPRRGHLAVLRELDAEIVERVEIRGLQRDGALPAARSPCGDRPGGSRPSPGRRVLGRSRHWRRWPARRRASHRPGGPRPGVRRQCSRASSRCPDRSRGCARRWRAHRRRGRCARRRCRARSTRRGSAPSRPPLSAARSPAPSDRLRPDTCPAESWRPASAGLRPKAPREATAIAPGTSPTRQ